MFQSNSNQMILDFDRPQVTNRKTRVDAVRGIGKAVFHPESSNFEATRFALKFSFRWGTYLVRWTYHTTAMSYLTDDQMIRVVDFIAIDTIRTYRNGGYVPSRLIKQEEAELNRVTYATIKDAYTNPFLTTSHTRNSMA